MRALTMKTMLSIVQVTLLMVVLSGIVGCGSKKKEEAKSIAQIQKEEGIPVSILQAGYGTIRAIEINGGTIEGIDQAVVKNGMPGTITSIRKKVGSFVKKGATIATINPDGGSPYTAVKSQFDYAEKAYQRAEELFKEGAVSQEMLDGAKAEYEGAKQQLNQTVEAITVIAPFSGTVIEIYETVNSKVGGGKKIAKVARLDRVRIELSINETVIQRYEEGQKAFVVLDADTLWGTVEKVALGADAMVHAFPVTTVFNNPDDRFKAGMFVMVNVIVEEHADALYVPIETVQFEQEETFVYVIQEDKAAKTLVETGIRNGASFEILRGLTAEDMVVVNGISLLSDGVKVKVVE